MGKKRKTLSHEEIWDDSALLNSWDAALQEYQLYHSIHARGERVEDILKEAEASEEVISGSDQGAGDPPSDLVNGLPHPEDLEDGEIEDDQADDSPNVASGAADVRVEMKGETPADQQHQEPAINPDKDAQNSEVPQSIPTVLTNGVQDEGLKNLMMSWYYAGYYTGLYEGRQQSGSATANAATNGAANH
ncbi:MAG: hypothetical protein Q9225_004754 [Loekoesia sp. 1 TL-2023]